MPVDYRMLDVQTPAKLGALAGQIQMPNKLQAEVDAMKIMQARNALADYAQKRSLEQAKTNALRDYYGLSDDPQLAAAAQTSPLAALELDKLKKGYGSQVPSDVRRFKYFESLSPEQKAQFLNLQRAPTWLNLGGQYVKPSQLDAGIQQTLERTLPPEQEPKVKAEQTSATEEQKMRMADIGKATSQIDSMNKQKSSMLEAVRQLEKGADTGLIESFLPSFRASTIALESTIKSLGLDAAEMLSGTLTDADMKLLLTKDVPTTMQEKDLLPYLQNKIEVLDKAQARVYDLLGHMRAGGTKADWLLKEKKRGKPKAPQKPTMDLSQGKFKVKAPNGKIYGFDTIQQAQEFKRQIKAMQ